MSIALKRSMPILTVLLLVLAFAGCQQVSDARAEFCNELRDIGAKAVELKAAKIDEPTPNIRAPSTAWPPSGKTSIV